MSNMRILYANHLDTTTLITVDSATDSVQYLFDRDTSNLYQSSGYDTTTSTTIVFTPTSAKAVDHIILQNMNLKAFQVCYETTTQLFTLTSGIMGTSAAHWDANAATNLCIYIPDVKTCSVIKIVAELAMTDDTEKKIGELWVCNQAIELEYNPTAKNYKTKFDRKEYVHEMSDGGTAFYALGNMFSADIKLDYVSASSTSIFWTLHNTYSPLTFIPFPTGASWDGKVYEVNWTGDYEFDQLTENAPDLGYEGTIRLRETAK